MVIVVTNEGVRLDDPEDLKGFKVVVEGGDAAEALAPIGRLADADTAWIRADAVREMASGRVGDGWDADFAGMLEYAASKGWIRDDGPNGGLAIQAHVERPG